MLCEQVTDVPGADETDRTVQRSSIGHAPQASGSGLEQGFAASGGRSGPPPRGGGPERYPAGQL